ncbi:MULTISPECIES: cache domain-containing sensor histidine kinase [Paenibacillus]|uniref:cache domain-containing sensor histidine kinase n=1 Tax=Paenibacillus TaxID=44249 RepID=UPI000895A442|nr:MULTISPECIES: sensor histidine kinase [Paenibacillus]MCZ1267600.1 sensor histidine kinase [Paenibacillus tundrae]SEA72004.1 two-component system, sensor histidine kinase YesM [Paenibacillus sp. 276b]SHN61390.1 two-component system, sensor histidine kinase YesM [Paenibacillus sp. ov031]SLJ89071.1 two-component system, sensor histidine kinase YesM [Paenibacillus sp. RU5A]SOC60147.1 two-component system, sensor histidine kinase YesM [Paenibacillus sp. RU26A]
MKHARLLPIKYKIMVICITVIILPVLVMTISSYYSSERLLAQNYTNLLNDLAKQTNIRIDEFLKEIEKITLLASNGLSDNLSATHEGSFPIQDFLREGDEQNEIAAYNILMNYIMMKDRVFSIYLYNLNGGQDLFVSPNQPIDPDFKVANELWFKKFMHDNDRTITLTTRIDEQLENKILAVSHARKIHDVASGELLGVIVVSIDIKFIEIVNRNLQEGLRSRFMIVDENDKIVYNVDDRLIGTLFRDNVRPPESLNVVVTSPLSQQKWTTYLYMPLDELTADGKILGHNLVTLSIVLVLFAAIISIFLSHVITTPIKKLLRNISLVEKGQFEQVEHIRSRDEIGHLSVRFNKMSHELKRMVERMQQEEIEKAKAEMRALHDQIKPHFLYNTLGSVKWIASMQQADKIVEMTDALISMLRYATRSDGTLVTIREEIDNIANYVTIQNVRYYDCIQMKYEIEDRLLDYRMPKMILQPIVENAIFHGLAELEEDGVITIRIQSRGRDIVIEVCDNGIGMDQHTIQNFMEDKLEADKGTGIGLHNVQRRIQLHFGKPYGIQVASQIGEGTTFTILLPAIKETL